MKNERFSNIIINFEFSRLDLAIRRWAEMKAVMKSVSTQICEKVTCGDCTILVSKTAPECKVPFKGYIYCCKAKSQWRYSDYEGAYENSKGEIVYAQQHIIGEFMCDEIIEWQYDKGHQYYVDYPDDCTSYFPYLKCHSEATGLKCSEIEKLGKGKPLYGLHISDLKIYDKPKELSEFERPCTYKGICYSCERFRPNGIPLPAPYGFCETKITRAPQGWCYVEEL